MSARLETKYLGLNLRNPLVASAGPLTGRLESLHALEEAGVAAVVLPSLFEEQIEHDDIEAHRLFMYQTESFAESLSHLPEIGAYPTGPDEYLARLAAAKKALGIPVIASLNGCTTGGWVRYAKMMQEAGADALELNIYMVADDECEPGAAVEERYIDLVTAVRETVTLPLAVKIGCQFSSLPNFVQQLVHAGADGLVLFNRYLEPDIDLEKLEVVPSLVLSQRHELRLPLRWIAILRDQTRTSLAATSGIHTAGDVLKALLVGADVAMMTSALLQSGPGLARKVLHEIRSWLDEREYESVDQLRGSMSRKNCPDPGAFERANYMRALTSYTAEYRAP
jgi:dihydroorotate dehydrogenase (fumarate)